MIAAEELMAAAIHDLKNPLASIRGLGQLGMLTSSSKRERSYFERIIKQVDSLNTSVIDLLSVFKPERSVKAKPSLIVKEVLDEFRAACDINNIKLIFKSEYEGEINLHIKVFKRAVENLVRNAVQILPDGGKIEIHTYEDENNFIMSINDNGPGIPDDMKESVFQPFFYQRKDGTGLGLFMVQHAITEVHGGKIWFNSKLGKGTTFYISLPKN